MKKIIISVVVAAIAIVFGVFDQGFVTSNIAEATSQSEVQIVQATTLNFCPLETAEAVGGERCYQCDEGKSTGDCAGANRCRGTKDSCKSKGCAFTGGSSSSCTASNYKYCK